MITLHACVALVMLEVCWVDARTTTTRQANFFHPFHGLGGFGGHFGLFHGGGLVGRPREPFQPPAAPNPVANPPPPAPASNPEPNMAVPGGMPPMSFLADAGSNILGYPGRRGPLTPESLLESLIPMPRGQGPPGAGGTSNTLSANIDFKPVIIVPRGKLDEKRIKELLKKHQGKKGKKG